MSLVRRYCPHCKLQWMGQHGDHCYACGYSPTSAEVILAIIMGRCDFAEETDN